MKFGYRKPNYKKSFKARTTGKFKRRIKKSINPYYGKKGAGWAHPRKALYNRTYYRTTTSLVHPSHKRRRRSTNNQYSLEKIHKPVKPNNDAPWYKKVGYGFAIIGYVYSLICYLAKMLLLLLWYSIKLIFYSVILISSIYIILKAIF